MQKDDAENAVSGKKWIKYQSISPSLTFGSFLNVSQVKGHCNLSQWTHCSWSIGFLLGSSHCFIFLLVFQGKVWKDHSTSQRRGLFQYPQSSGSHPLNCSLHHTKRFRKSCFFYCCCVFPQLNNALPPQGPITAHRSALGSPPPLIPPSLSRFSHLAPAHFHIYIPLSERRQHARGCGQSKHTHLSLDACQFSLKIVNFVSFQINLVVVFKSWNKDYSHSASR